MKISANAESVQVLNDLSLAIPLSLAVLEDESAKLMELIERLEEDLGERFNLFKDLISQCVLAVLSIQEPVEYLARGLIRTAERLDFYLLKERKVAMHGADVRSGIGRTMNTPEEIGILREIDSHDDIGPIYVDAQRDEPQPNGKRLPTKAMGVFVGPAGDSLFIPHGAKAKSYLRNCGRRGIEYKDGYPDFAPFAQILTPWGDVDAQVRIGHMTSFRRNPTWVFGKRTKNQSYNLACDLGNFNQADIALADKLCEANSELAAMKRSDLCRDIAAFRKESKLTWHECADGYTMQLIPSVVHNACPHSGGVSFEKLRAAYGDAALNIPEEL